MSNAEQDFRSAFERLKSGTSEIMPAGTPVSQNNIAREAGREPSSFKKSRYLGLIAEIQTYVAAFKNVPPVSARKKTLRKRKRNRTLKKMLEDMVRERDHALSLLVEADSKILELCRRIDDLERSVPPSTVRRLSQNPD
jgi:hypothetical protein